MLRFSPALCSFCFRKGAVHRTRFVPPWERDGKSPEDFFSGLMQSKNPLQRRRKETAAAARQMAEAQQESPAPEEERRALEIMQRREAEQQRRRQFLPYGAVPVQYFDTTKMAAWGEYKSRLIAMSADAGGNPATGSSKNNAAAAMSNTSLPPSQQRFYSREVMSQLETDMDVKIPYRYESCPAIGTLLGSSPSSNSQPQWPFHGSAGLVLDIDGVIYRSKQIIPGSDEAIQRLKQLKIPFVFMTNGGGVTEAAKARELSGLLNCEIDSSQIVLCHSPMRYLAPHYRHSNVLIAGGAECENIAREYGFENPISVERFQCEHPELVPYKNWNGLKKAAPYSIPYPAIDAVFSFTDFTDLLSDTQVILDVLLAPYGNVGTAVSATQTIPYYYGADDLLWATEAPLPRLGGGAMREMISSVMESVSGERLQVIMYGKPRAIAYAYAERQLKHVSEKLGWDPKALRNIFMIGDNIETDIQGANAAGGLWTSVHVLSGIGAAPAALRTLIEGDEEQVWLERHASKIPHYVAPTLDHFVRELLSFPEEAIKGVKQPYYGVPNPVNLKEVYNFE